MRFTPFSLFLFLFLTTSILALSFSPSVSSSCPSTEDDIPQCSSDLRHPLRPSSSSSSSSSSTSQIIYPPPRAFIQHPAPTFTAPVVLNGEVTTLSSSSFLGKWLILLFYPSDFTFVCPTEIIAFSDSADEFRKLNAEVVAISVDSPFSHLAWTNMKRKEGGLGKMNIPLVSDITKSIAADYGVLLQKEGVALRGLFLIDPKGTLRQSTVNDLPVGRSVDETLRLLSAFQFSDLHGEVCPANWRPGKDSMKADPKLSKEYFSKQQEN